ncbi:MAG: hypothetical protein WBP93_00755 [Pyrinomonadaceae bacterium]
MISLSRTRSSILFFLNLLSVVALLTAAVVLAQEQEEGGKGIKSEEVVPRAKSKSSSSTSQDLRRKKTYTSNVKRLTAVPPKGEEDVRLGLTIFRYEPRGTVYRPDNEGTKDILMEGTEEAPTPPNKLAEWNVADWTRAMPDNHFAVGQVVRLHFEPLTKAGYLYILHQELYASGTTGPARLLFPTLRTNNGNNLVQPNVDLWIPRAPAYFRIKPSESNKAHVGELLTVVLRAEAPNEILRQSLEDKPLLLEADDLKRLIAGAKGTAIRMNLDGGEGQKQTTQEMSKDIGMEGDEALTQDDPLPQTVYETRRQAGQPVVFRIPLKFKEK